MNQILITEKLYITPELKRKKRIYKIDFILSVILIVVLVSIYLYSYYERNKSEAVSQEILSGLTDDTTISDDVLVVYLNKDAEEVAGIGDESSSSSSSSNSSGSSASGQTTKVNQTITTESGETYSTVASISIPSINVNYAVLSETTDELLKISPCKFWGPNANEAGNFCIVGHNYRNSKFFSKVPSLEVGDSIYLTDTSNRTLEYKVYDKYTVEPTDVKCTSQLTNGKTELTLITCTNDSKQRVVVKARN
jgi:LPXTG-site transpeptidase (sortase) family protein